MKRTTELGHGLNLSVVSFTDFAANPSLSPGDESLGYCQAVRRGERDSVFSKVFQILFTVPFRRARHYACSLLRSVNVKGGKKKKE